MKFGDEVEILNQIYILQPNLTQILTERPSCNGCAFDTNQFSCAGLACGLTISPKDRQFIYVLKEVADGRRA